MGIEYQKFRIKIKHKKSGHEYILTKQIGHTYNTPLLRKEEFEVGDLQVVSG